MATVRAIIADALMEIGALAAGETMSAGDAQLGLLRFQNQLDAWQADALTLAVQKRVTFVLTSGTASVTIGPAGGTVTAVRPVWLEGVNYVNPGSSPAQEVPIGLMDRDQFMALSIKGLSSSLPLAAFYQTSTDTVLGSLTFWPVVDQNVTIVLYYPAGVAVPATLDDVLLGPPGYQDAYMYELADRLCTPFARVPPEGLDRRMREASARMKRPNTQPGMLGVDLALQPMQGSAYNVLSDTYTGSSNR